MTTQIGTHQLFIHDPLLDKWSHRHVTVVQLGAQCVLPTSLDNAPEWDTSTSAEFSLLLSRRLFVSDDAWTSFVTDCRRVVPNQICSLHKDFSSSTVEFYTWSRLDAHTHRVTLRAPACHKNLLLQASGVAVQFIIQELCRDEQAVERRNTTSAVVWLGKRSYDEALTTIKQIETHQGLALSKQSFGIRVLPTELSTVRRLINPNDSMFSDANRHIRGSKLFLISGLPVGSSRADLVKKMAAWKKTDDENSPGWDVIPIRQWHAGSQPHWVVRADADPPSRCYTFRTGRALVQPWKDTERAPRAQSVKPAQRPKSTGPSNRPAPFSSSVPSSTTDLNSARITAIEQRIDALETRSNTLESKIDTGFTAILARLDSGKVSRPAPGTTGETPPPKQVKATASTAVAPKQLALGNQ